MNDFGPKKKMHSTIPKHDYSISSAIQLIRDKIISITRYSFTNQKEISLYRKPISMGFNQFRDL